MWPRYEDGKYYCFPKDFKISAWTAEGWKDIVIKKDYSPTSTPITLQFDKVVCSKIRFTATKLTEAPPLKDRPITYSLQLLEMQVWGCESPEVIPGNIAVGKSVYAGSLLKKVEFQLRR